jgi:Zn-dependent membrane protease YugP
VNSTAIAKIALTIVAFILVGYGMRVDSPTLRWVGIAFLAAAFALRFIKPPVKGE